jgi:monovalent cation/proton antiporter MnhG/PhaG subunit
VILDVILKSIAVTFSLLGMFFFLVGTVGIIRLPDFYSRTHPATKCDTLGAGSILIGLAILEKLSPEALKIVALAGFILLTSPTVGHALARSAFKTGLSPWTKRKEKETRKEVERV